MKVCATYIVHTYNSLVVTKMQLRVHFLLTLSLSPKSNLALLSADVQQQSLPHCIRGYICSNAAAASTPHAHLSGNSGLKQRRFSEQKSNKRIRHPRRVFLARLRTHMLRLTVPAKDLHWPLPVSRSTRADVILRPV